MRPYVNAAHCKHQKSSVHFRFRGEFEKAHKDHGGGEHRQRLPEESKEGGFLVENPMKKSEFR